MSLLPAGVPVCVAACRSLGFALRRLSHDQLVIDPVQLSQYVTLVFIGTISALSIRAFLRNASLFFSTLTQFRGWFGLGGGFGGGSGAAGTVGKGFAGSSRVPSGGGGASLVLMLSELTGVYSISSLLLIRRNVPVKYRDIIDAVLGGQLEFQYFHRWACVCRSEGTEAPDSCWFAWRACSAATSRSVVLTVGTDRCLMPCAAAVCTVCVSVTQMVQRAVHCQCPADGGAILCTLQGGRDRADGVVAAHHTQNSGFQGLM